MIGDEERRAVLEVLESQSLFRHYGPRPLHKASLFERAFAEAMGAKHALGVTSGTTALLTALAALGVGPGDEVIVPTYTWIATINAVVLLGAVPVFVDIDETLTMDPRAVDAAVTPHTVAILPVHMRGAGADLDPILATARRRGLGVIEDAAQALGGSYHGRRVGTYGAFGAFSLQYHKVITTGEGGVVIGNDTALFERAVRYHDQGSVRMEELDEVIPADNPLVIGTNFRMAELTAAVGLAQLPKMNGIIERMRAHKQKMIEGVRGIASIRVRPVPDPAGDTGATFIFFLPAVELATRFAAALSAENIHAGVAWASGQHVYYHFDQIIERRFLSRRHCSWGCPHYKGTATLQKGQFPESDRILKHAVHIDIHPLLSQPDVEDVITGIHKVAGALL